MTQQKDYGAINCMEMMCDTGWVHFFRNKFRKCNYKSISIHNDCQGVHFW